MGLELVTVPDVEVVSTGTYELGSGKTTFTAEDLADAVRASTDPTIVAPRIKLGHIDKRFAADLDGEPAFGVVANMRLTNNGQTIKGDLTGVPKWLADAAPSAFPNRSIEGGFNFQAASGHKYRLVISNLAMLGTTWPGVTSLKDLQDCLTANGPVLAPTQASGGGWTLKGKEGEGHAERVVAAKVGTPVVAAIDLGAFNRRFATDLLAGKVPTASLPDVGEQKAWWPRSVQAEGEGKLSLVIDDDKGHLLSVPFEVGEGDDVRYGTPALVEQKPVAASAAHSSEGPRILASWPSTPAARPTTEVKQMDVSVDVLRKRLGLPEDATEEQITAKLGESPEAPEPAKPANVPEGMTLIDSEKLAELESGAKAGASVAASLAQRERDEVIAKAIEEGRFAVGRKDHYVRSWDKDPEGTRHLLTAKVEDGGLASVIPVQAREHGAAGDGEGGESEDAIVASFERQFFPELAEVGSSNGGAS